MPAAEPTFLALSDEAADPTEGSNTEHRGGGVGSDTSNFFGGATYMISGTWGSDEPTDRVTEGGDIDGKRYMFEDSGDNGVGGKNNILDSGDK